MKREANDSATVCNVNSPEIENDNINRSRQYKALPEDVSSAIVRLYISFRTKHTSTHASLMAAP